MRRDGWAALDWPGGEPKLGATALMAAGLAERRVATGEESYDGLMRELGRFMRTMQRPDGGFYNGWRVAAGNLSRDVKVLPRRGVLGADAARQGFSRRGLGRRRTEGRGPARDEAGRRSGRRVSAIAGPVDGVRAG